MQAATLIQSLVLSALVATSAFSQQNEWIGTRARGTWRTDRHWSLGEPTPNQHFLVNTSSSRGQVTISREPVEAAAIQIGFGPEKAGELRVLRESLVVAASLEDANSGELTIGSDSGSGVVRVQRGTLNVENTVVVADGAGSTGTLEIESGSTVTCGMLQISTAEGGTGKLIIDGPRSNINCVALLVESPDTELLFKGRRELSPLQTQAAPVLSGTLTVDAPRLIDDVDEILLIDNLGPDPIAGHFTEVSISGSRKSYYELSYHGGDGNDLVLLRSDTPIDTIEQWNAHHFDEETPPEITDLFADPDSDGVTNILEYKLGRSPLQPERPIESTQTTDGTTQVTTTVITLNERNDRNDVRVTPQAKLIGKHWQSGYFSETPEVLTDKHRRIEYRAETSEVPEIRFFADLMPNKEKLNVLFVMSDDLSDWLGCMNGHPQAHTPNLDRLAERSMLFQNAHCSGIICGPSRAALLTGIPPSTSGLYRNTQLLRDNPMLTNAWTIPSYFKSQNYFATGSGKIFHKGDPQSWSEYYPSLTEFRPPPYRPPEAPFTAIRGRGSQFDWAPLDVPVETMSDHQIATWVGQRFHTLSATDPFFMACGFFRPHLPFYAPRQYFDLFDPETIQLPAIYEDDLDDLSPAALATISQEDHGEVIATGEWKNAVHNYLACVAFMDDQVGRVLDQLDASPHGRNTIIVFTSDHGFMLGEKTGWRKLKLWDRATRVPMIISVPGMTKPGSVCDAPVSLLDLFPTLTSLCDIGRPEQVTGRDITPLLQDANATMPPVVSTRNYKQHGVHDTRFHYIRYPAGDQELYDLWVDPHEWFNLASTPEAAAIMQSLSEFLPSFDALP